MIYPPQPPNRLVGHWIERHRNRTSFILHIIGIPPTILGVLLLLDLRRLCSRGRSSCSPLALCSWEATLQFAGHGLEGTDPGEIIYFKRKLGMPYVEFPPGRVRSRAGSNASPARHDQAAAGSG